MNEKTVRYYTIKNYRFIPTNHEIGIVVWTNEASTRVVAVSHVRDGINSATESTAALRTLAPQRDAKWILLPRRHAKWIVCKLGVGSLGV